MRSADVRRGYYPAHHRSGCEPGAEHANGVGKDVGKDTADGEHPPAARGRAKGEERGRDSLEAMRSQDTSVEAHEVQQAVLRRLGPPERLRLALDLSVATRALAESRIRHDHPDYDAAAVRHELLRLLYGAAVPGAFL